MKKYLLKKFYSLEESWFLKNLGFKLKDSLGSPKKKTFKLDGWKIRRKAKRDLVVEK